MHRKREVSKEELLEARKKYLAALPAESNFDAPKVYTAVKSAFISEGRLDEETGERLAKEYTKRLESTHKEMQGQRRLLNQLVAELS